MRYALDNPKCQLILDAIDELALGLDWIGNNEWLGNNVSGVAHDFNERSNEMIRAAGLDPDLYTLWLADRIASLPDYSGNKK